MRQLLVALFAIGCAAGAVAQEIDEDAPINVRLATAAFAALDQAKRDGDYQPVLDATQQCIARLSEDANIVAGRLQREGVQQIDPRDIGRTNEARRPIFERGAYNDVAACWFVKVAAHVARREGAQAEQAYRQLCRYSLALVFDPPPHDWFWSPTQGARSELRSMGITPRCAD